MRTALSLCLLLCAKVAADLRAAEIDAALKITSPLPYSVTQRDGFDPAEAHVHAIGGPQLGFADVAIAAEVTGLADDITAQFRIVPLPDAFGQGRDWTPLPAHTQAGRLVATARIPAGGWYRLELRAAAGGKTAAAAVEPVGVGEVLVVAGQSYASGSNAELLKVEDPRGRVVVYDTVLRSWRVANDPLPNVSTRGTIWPSLGNLLLPLLRVPVGFVDVAVGGTSSRQWMPGEKLYRNLDAAGRTLRRFRAVLWQQGESDVAEKTPAARYIANLTSIRRSLEGNWGFAPRWLLAKSTLHPPAYNNPAQEAVIRGAIAELWRRPGFFPGPDTDILGGENRADFSHGRHFSGIGQRRAALLWFASVWELLNRTSPPRKLPLP